MLPLDDPMWKQLERGDRRAPTTRRCARDDRRRRTATQRFRSLRRFAAIRREARTRAATCGTQAMAAVQIIAMMVARAAARCRWRMRDTGSAARTRFEKRASTGRP